MKLSEENEYDLHNVEKDLKEINETKLLPFFKEFDSKLLVLYNSKKIETLISHIEIIFNKVEYFDINIERYFHLLKL